MKWNTVKYQASEGILLPATSGMYAVYTAKERYGLPFAVQPVYVGISSDLRRRFHEHLQVDEPNHLLRKEIAYAEEVRFWYTSLPIWEAAVLEPEVIRELRPVANRQHRPVATSIDLRSN